MITKREIDETQAELLYHSNRLLSAIRDIKSARMAYSLNFGNSWIHILGKIGVRLIRQQNELLKIKDPIAPHKLDIFLNYINSEIRVLNKMMTYLKRASLDYLALEEIEEYCDSLIGVSQQAPTAAKALISPHANYPDTAASAYAP